MSGGTIVLAAGGTGGHLFPAEAVARVLLERGCAVHLLTDRRAAAFGERVPGVVVDTIRAGTPSGSAIARMRGIAEIAIGMMQARRLLRRLAPRAVIGFGGYPSVPTMAAATRLGLSTVIHEQNAVLGRANRVLAPRVARIATGFAATAGLRPADAARMVHTGNPVRPAILALGERPYGVPAERGPIELLVLGGSQGARIFSEIVPPALAALPAALRQRLRLSQQARPEDRDAVAAALGDAGIAADVATFFIDVPERLARAHLAICRAGASTIAELAASGRPALLVPYPHATDDHQSANAAAFAAAGGGWVAPQAALSAEALAARLLQLLGDPAGLSCAAGAARGFARRDAAARLAALALGETPEANGDLPQQHERAA